MYFLDFASKKYVVWNNKKTFFVIPIGMFSFNLFFLLKSILNGLVLSDIWIFLSMTIWLIEMLFWLKETNTNKVGLIFSNITEKVVAKTGEGFVLVPPRNYRTKLDDNSHNNENEIHLDDQARKQRVLVEGLMSKDGESFSLEVTYWTQLEVTRAEEIVKLYGGEKQLLEELKNYLEKDCKLFDGDYLIDEIMIDSQKCLDFFMKVENKFRNEVGNENEKEPIIISKFKPIIFEPIPSAEYKEKMQKVKTAQKEAEKNKTISEADQKAVQGRYENGKKIDPNYTYEMAEQAYFVSVGKAEQKNIKLSGNNKEGATPILPL